MTEENKIIRHGLSTMYDYASTRFRNELIEARKEFDRLVPIPPADDPEMRSRLIMFSHWFLMDRYVEPDRTPADIFFHDNLISFSYEEEALYRALRISRVGIYNAMDRHDLHTASDIATGERFEFSMNENIGLQASGEILTMRFIGLDQTVFLLASYATHHYSTRDFIHERLATVSPFDRTAFSREVFALTALSIKSRKYTWVEPIKIYQGVTKL